MAVAYLQSVSITSTSSTTVTVNAGSNRALIILSGGEGGVRPMTSVQWGGVNVGQALYNAQQPSGGGRYISSWLILESEIATYSGQGMQPFYGTNPSSASVRTYIFTGVNQSYTIAGYDNSSGTTGGTSTSTTITIPTDGAGLMHVCTDWDTGASFTWSASPGSVTEIDDNAGAANGTRHSRAYSLSSGSQTFTASWTDSVGAAILGLALDPVAAATSPNLHGKNSFQRLGSGLLMPSRQYL